MRISDWSSDVCSSDLAKELKTSMHGLLLGCFAALLSRLSGDEDIVLGIPVAGQARNHLDVVGYCVELLPIRSQPAAEKPFSTFAHEIQRRDRKSTRLNSSH